MFSTSQFSLVITARIFKSYLILPLLLAAHLTYADGSSWVNFCLCQQTSKLFPRVLLVVRL